MWWCLHGALGSFRDWNNLDLVDARAVDLWQTPAQKNMASWAQHWVRDIEKIDPQPSLLGYSMGGRLALHALAVAPGFWKRAVIISAHPGLRDPVQRETRRHHDAAWVSRFQSEPFQDVLLDWNAQPVFAHRPDTTAFPQPERFESTMERCFQQWSLGNQAPLWDSLGTIDCPVWWLCGEHDSKFTAIGLEAVDHLRQGTHVVAQGCHHRVPWEWPSFSRWIREL